MTFYLTKSLALCRQRELDKKSFTMIGIFIHWMLVFYYLKGFYQGFIQDAQQGSLFLQILFTLVVVLASASYWMACLSDPGHIDYEMQDRLSSEKLNNRLYEQLVKGKITQNFDVLHEHTETELVEQESIVESQELGEDEISLDIISDGDISHR